MALPVNIDDLINHRKVEWARIKSCAENCAENCADTPFCQGGRENGDFVTAIA